jgi:hypothetical protein
VITRPADTVKVNTWLTVTELLSFTWMVKVKVPLETGVPVIRLLTVLKLKPFGSAPAVMLKEYGGLPPDAARG